MDFAGDDEGLWLCLLVGVGLDEVRVVVGFFGVVVLVCYIREIRESSES